MKNKAPLILILSAALLLCSACKNTPPEQESRSPVAQGSFAVSETEGSSESGTKPESKTESSGKEVSVSSATNETTSSQESEEGLTSEEIDDMDKVGNAFSERFEQADYKSADVKGKSEIALKLLNELAEKGLIIKSSIYYDESSSLISFSYSSGVLGGIKLTSFDPMFNGTDPEPTVSVPEVSEQQSKPSVSSESVTSYISVPESDMKLVNKKDLTPFLTSAEKDTGESKNMFSAFIEKMKNSKHSEFAIAGDIASDGKTGVLFLERQSSGDRKYLSIRHDMEDYSLDNNQTLILKDNVTYILDNKNKTWRTSTDPNETGYFEVLFSFGDTVGNEKAHGTCLLDDKNVYFEMIEDDTGMTTVAYFDGDEFIKAEIYESENAAYENSDSILAGYFYAVVDIPINEKLFDIPSDYSKT